MSEAEEEDDEGGGGGSAGPPPPPLLLPLVLGRLETSSRDPLSDEDENSETEDVGVRGVKGLNGEIID